MRTSNHFIKAGRGMVLLGVLAGLAACTSAPVKRTDSLPVIRQGKVAQKPVLQQSTDPSSAQETVTASTASPSQATRKSGWEPAPQGSGYYLDDGPGDLRPANLHELPSAQPRVEPIAIHNTRPYTVMGLDFTPQTSLDEPFSQKGRASWYGKKFHGAKTANGEIYDMHQMTAAHPTLPLPSYAKVTNLANGKSVIVRVNDRGPFLRNRVIDLSYAAAFQLDYIHHGVAEVLVEKMTPADIALYQAEKGGTQLARRNPSVEQVGLGRPASQPQATGTPLYVQVGVFGNRVNAETLVGKVRRSPDSFSQASQILTESGIHRVLVGPFANLDQANEAVIKLSTLVETQPLIKQDLILP